MTQACVFPLVFLKNFHADQVRHDVGETVVVVSFDPDYFDVALGIGEFADRAEKLPVFFLEASEVEVGKDVGERLLANFADSLRS